MKAATAAVCSRVHERGCGKLSVSWVAMMIYGLGLSAQEKCMLGEEVPSQLHDKQYYHKIKHLPNPTPRRETGKTHLKASTLH